MTTPKEYQALIADGCPHCGEALQIKRGKHGEFIACSDWCGYTKSILGRSSYPLKEERKPCPYNKCDGSSLIPLKSKDGSIVPYAWIDCECKAPDIEGYQALRLGDFDFPMSDAFRGFSFEQSGEPDPGPCEPALEEQVYTPPEPQWKKEQWQYVGQLRAQINHLNKKFIELEKTKKRSKRNVL